MTNIQAIDLLKDLEQNLDDYCELNDEGKTAFRMAITALELFGNSEQLPSAQPNNQVNLCDSCKYLYPDCPSEADDVIFGNGKGNDNICACNKYLPSAQPDIIRCEDCKWYGRADKRRFYRGMDCLQKRIDTIVPDRDFCSKAERRTDD